MKNELIENFDPAGEERVRIKRNWIIGIILATLIVGGVAYILLVVAPKKTG
ncbi:MAG: hypothetical protein V1712_02930 [Patescibacteria group bacterium]